MEYSKSSCKQTRTRKGRKIIGGIKCHNCNKIIIKKCPCTKWECKFCFDCSKSLKLHSEVSN